MVRHRDDHPFVTPRVCRLCGGRYFWPKDCRRPGSVGPCCQPSLFDEEDGALFEPRLRAALGRRVVGGDSVETAVPGW